MNKIKQICKFLFTSPDQWFFYLFLLNFTLSVRKVLFFYPFPNNFNENTGVYVYLSDIFLLLAFILWAFLLHNKNIHLSSKAASLLKSLSFSLYKHQLGDFIFILKSLFSKHWHISMPFCIVFLSFFSIIWSENKVISFYRTIKLLEFYLLYAYLISNLRGSEGKIFLSNIFKLILLSAVFHSMIAIIQFLTQHSVGLFWLKESLISQEIPGVAKLIFNHNKYIRAYGLFPHPNILGGFLLFSIVLTWYYKKLLKIVPRGTIWDIFLAIQIIALLLTFSKSAILGLFIAILYIFMKIVPRLPANEEGGTIWDFSFGKIVPRGTIYVYLILLTASITITIFLLKPDLNSLFINSLKERWFYLSVSSGIIVDNLLLGVGSGQFILNIPHYIGQRTIPDWQFQPVHNVFLLIWNELGIVGLGLFVWFLIKLFHVEHFKQVTNQNCSTWNILSKLRTKIVPRGTILSLQYQKYLLNTLFKAILLGFIFIMFFDHYLWDIHQGQIILWITLGLVVGSSQKTEKEPVR